MARLFHRWLVCWASTSDWNSSNPSRAPTGHSTSASRPTTTTPATSAPRTVATVDEGWDVVLGNLGDDYISGGEGDDWVRGGQGDDEVLGGAGWDFVSGDRGNDTLTGGTGADLSPPGGAGTRSRRCGPARLPAPRPAGCG